MKTGAPVALLQHVACSKRSTQWARWMTPCIRLNKNSRSSQQPDARASNRFSLRIAVEGNGPLPSTAIFRFKEPPHTVQQPLAFSTATLSFSTATLSFSTATFQLQYSNPFIQYSNPPAHFLPPYRYGLAILRQKSPAGDSFRWF